MEPFEGLCAAAEEKMEHGIVNISTKRSGHASGQEDSLCDDKVDPMNVSKATGWLISHFISATQVAKYTLQETL